MHVIAAVIVAGTAGSADGSCDEVRFEVAIRTGIGIATGRFLEVHLGGATNNPRLDRVVPLWIEAGYHLSPALIVGPYFQYTFGRVDPAAVPSTSSCGPPFKCSSSGYIVRVGGELQYRFLTDSMLIPWLGLGAGYLAHSARLEFTGPTASGSFKGTASGLDLNLQTGADVRLSSWFALGLYASFFTGESAGVEAGLRARLGL
jgi:hypothetical protein